MFYHIFPNTFLRSAEGPLLGDALNLENITTPLKTPGKSQYGMSDSGPRQKDQEDGETAVEASGGKDSMLESGLILNKRLETIFGRLTAMLQIATVDRLLKSRELWKYLHKARYGT